jgi:glutamyl/glutaminyl-tRNA synthetase
MSVQITISKPINYKKLLGEFSAVGFMRVSYNANTITAEDTNNQSAVQAVYDAHNPNPTAAEIAALDRKEAAPENLKKVMELNDLIPNQAAEWLERKVHAGKKRSELLSEITNATTVAALKAPMSELAEMLYQSTEANKKIVRLLVAVKDLYL